MVIGDDINRVWKEIKAKRKWQCCSDCSSTSLCIPPEMNGSCCLHSGGICWLWKGLRKLWIISSL
ncbi:hypothetical protein CIPAW_16G118800 [Carya illinoinensis]|uniref:Uncharacterized protein n=1 Tax=Carya illinoinensis TaxID=32201 RepID=A0A8T1N9L7_CARIL|nr:hypothetical protein CIPAW_16G118800 [Carya illinoinensis]